ncbi:MAG: Uma2 family endonuclease [Actinomycetota bacterium]|jgi:Uma2 family endonuclease|nr:Uma2 family endonuclease [Actinomycetota bacterium]
MRTLLPDPPPPELQGPLRELLERRRRWGADTHDEVWGGVLHMAPAPHRRHAELQVKVMDRLREPAERVGLTRVAEFNLGEPGDYRVPDGGLFGSGPGHLYNPTAALVVEVLSTGDDTWKKLPFYAAHHVEEILIGDPDERSVQWLALTEDGYRPVDRSTLVELGPAQMEHGIEWPD